VAHPNHADSAMLAALEMKSALARFNAELATESRAKLAFGIGINTSKIIAGNIGSSRRLNYSVIGDGVNVAARLQDLTRMSQYRADILVSASTLKAARRQYRVCPLAAALIAARAAPPAIDGAKSVALPFSLGEVRLLDSPFRQAMEKNADYLLSIEPDRLLHNTRRYAGLEPKGETYGGWEARGIAGHTLGHYLTALSQQYAATGDMRFRRRIDYIVSEMAECQKAYGDGYIGALPPLELQTMRNFREGIVEPLGPFNFKGGAWVPWYTEHKVLNGLKDAWTLGGS